MRERLRRSLATGRIALNGRVSQMTTAELRRRRPRHNTSVLLDEALAARPTGRSPRRHSERTPVAMHGVTLHSGVAYDHDKLAAAVETLSTSIDQNPADASVSAGQDGTFSVSPAKDGRAVDTTALLTALDQQLSGLGTPESITMAVPVVSVAPAVATASAGRRQRRPQIE